MKTLLVILSLFILSGCEHMEFVAVDYHSGHNYGPYFQPTGHISYTLGYYTGSHYNGYSVHGSHGHRYYYAPRNYAHHHYYPTTVYVRPVVVHQHVHVSACYTRGGHSYNPPRPRTSPPPRQRQHTVVPDRQPNRVVRQRDRQPDRVAPQRQPDRVAPQRNQTRATPQRQTTRVAPQRRTEQKKERPNRGKRQNRERQNEK